MSVLAGTTTPTKAQCPYYRYPPRRYYRPGPRYYHAPPYRPYAGRSYYRPRPVPRTSIRVRL